MADTNPFKLEVNVVDACFYYRETQPITFDSLDQKERLTMLKFSKDKHVMLQVASNHRGNKHIVPYVRPIGSTSIVEVND